MISHTCCTAGYSWRGASFSLRRLSCWRKFYVSRFLAKVGSEFADDIAALDMFANGWPAPSCTSRLQSAFVDSGPGTWSVTARASRSLSAAVLFCAIAVSAPAKTLHSSKAAVDFCAGAGPAFAQTLRSHRTAVCFSAGFIPASAGVSRSLCVSLSFQGYSLLFNFFFYLDDALLIASQWRAEGFCYVYVFRLYRERRVCDGSIEI